MKEVEFEGNKWLVDDDAKFIARDEDDQVCWYKEIPAKAIKRAREWSPSSDHWGRALLVAPSPALHWWASLAEIRGHETHRVLPLHVEAG